MVVFKTRYWMGQCFPLILTILTSSPKISPRNCVCCTARLTSFTHVCHSNEIQITAYLPMINIQVTSGLESDMIKIHELTDGLVFWILLSIIDKRNAVHHYELVYVSLMRWNCWRLSHTGCIGCNCRSLILLFASSPCEHGLRISD